MFTAIFPRPQVNFLSHWLLTNLLLEQEHARRPKARDGAGDGTREGTRVVMVSSVVHRAGPLQWPDLNSERWCVGA